MIDAVSPVMRRAEGTHNLASQFQAVGITGATDRLIISAPFPQPGAGISAGMLNAAFKAALQRGVGVELVTTGQSLSGLDIASLKGAAKGCLPTHTTNVLDSRVLGSQAKFCVSDGVAAYIGSSDPDWYLARGGQIELGVLGARPLAGQQMEEFWILCHLSGLFIEV